MTKERKDVVARELAGGTRAAMDEWFRILEKELSELNPDLYSGLMRTPFTLWLIAAMSQAFVKGVEAAQRCFDLGVEDVVGSMASIASGKEDA